MTPGNGAKSVHPERPLEVSLVVYLDGPKAGSVRVLRLENEGQLQTFMPVVQRPMTVEQAKRAAPITSSHEAVTMYRVAEIQIDRELQGSRPLPAAKVVFLAQGAREKMAELGKDPDHFLALDMRLPAIGHENDLRYAMSHGFQLIANEFARMRAGVWGKTVLMAAGLWHAEQRGDAPLESCINEIKAFLEAHPKPPEDEE